MNSVTAGGQLPYRDFIAQGLHYLTRTHSGVPTAEIISSANWKGAALSPDQITWRFTAKQIAALEQRAEEIQLEGKSIAEVAASDFDIPALAGFIRDWRQALTDGAGVVLAKGLPVHSWGKRTASLVYWGIGHLLGKPGAQNPQQELLGHVKDYREHHPEVRLYRTNAHIRFHCDPADVVGLLCLQPSASGGASRIASSVAIFNEIRRRDPQLAARLFKPFRMDRRGEETPGSRPWDLITPSCFDGATLRTFWHTDYFESVARHQDVELTREESTLIEWFEEIGNDPAFRLDMDFEAGDIQLISNHSIVHGRTAYTDNDTSRHLLRLWLSLE
ncbi:MAG: TauD/TfdA family dioxygenase [Halieaceae bacterium]|nr:TauD/TfdA family dioxygenase [Halieaceae bacterium]